MTNATMNRSYNPVTSPLFGIAAAVAAALTIGTAVLLPAKLAPQNTPLAAAAATQRTDAQAPAQLVVLPTVDVVGTRNTKSAANGSYAIPAVFKQKS